MLHSFNHTLILSLSNINPVHNGSELLCAILLKRPVECDIKWNNCILFQLNHSTQDVPVRVKYCTHCEAPLCYANPAPLWNRTIQKRFGNWRETVSWVHKDSANQNPHIKATAKRLLKRTGRHRKYLSNKGQKIWCLICKSDFAKIKEIQISDETDKISVQRMQNRCIELFFPFGASTRGFCGDICDKRRAFQTLKWQLAERRQLVRLDLVISQSQNVLWCRL